MKKILVPTDFSTYADKALNYAVEIAKRSGAEVLILHAASLFAEDFASNKELVNDYNHSEKKNLKSKLQAYKDSIQNSEHIKVSTLLYDGNVVETILYVAELENVDLIIMGTLGSSGIKTMIFGTHAAETLASSKVPVVTIPFDYEWSEPKKIAIAVNEKIKDVQLLQPIFQIASLFDSEVMTLIYSDEDDEAVEVLEHSYISNVVTKKLKRSYSGITDDTVHIVGNNFQETLQEFIDEENIDLLVMITHKRSFIEKLFKSSMTKQMAYHTRIPLLSFNSI